MRTLPTLLIATAALALGGSASAQTREGFFIGVGTGWGFGEASAAGFPTTHRDSTWLAPILRLGGKISDRLSLGTEWNYWGGTDENRHVGVNDYNLTLYYYPAQKGVFLKGGLGVSYARAGRHGQESASGTGPSGMLGLGYDLRIGTRTAITPTASFWFGGPGDLSVEDTVVVQGFKRNVVQLGVGFSFY